MMPEISLQLAIFLVCVGLFTLTAAISDYRTRRIPNKLTVPVFVLGLIYRGGFDGLAGLHDAGLAFLLGFGLLFLLWVIGGGGGGDVKLMGALSVWLGWYLTLWVLIVSTFFVIGGTALVMLVSLFRKGIKRTGKKYLATGKVQTKRRKQTGETREQKQQRRVMAFAIPVALATWVIVLYKLPTLPF